MRKREIVAGAVQAVVLTAIGGWLGYAVSTGSLSIIKALLIGLLAVVLSAVIRVLITDPWLFR